MNRGEKKETLLVALGGNALIRKGEEGTIDQQFTNLRVPVGQIARLHREYRIVITHGNGPQVGNLLLQQECCPALPQLPLEILVAQTQGQLGYMIEATLDSEFLASGAADVPYVASLVSYVVVDEKDPALRNPTKPIGPVYTAEEAAGAPWPVVETAKGYRRVVASPRPVTIVEKREIRKLIELDFIVVCCGGGGIPVVREGRAFHGIDAVIDKDLASARLAEEVGVDILVIATDVPGVALNFGKPTERYLSTMTIEQAVRYLEDGEFPAGSMGPKVEAAVEFIRGGGKRALIAAIEDIEAAVRGEAGTAIEL